MSRVLWALLAAVVVAAGLVVAFWPSPGRLEAERVSRQVAEMADAWTGEVQFEASYAPLNPYAGAQAASADGQPAATGFDPTDEFWGLPRTPGYEDVAYMCSACHSLQLVMQQGRSEARWNELIDWMITQQGMGEPPADSRARIVAYLTRTYGDAPATP